MKGEAVELSFWGLLVASWVYQLTLGSCIGNRLPWNYSHCIMYKWKNYFYKMKGDVGMSGHEKERKQEDAYTKIQTHS